MTHSHTNPDATQIETQTAQHDLQEEHICTVTLQMTKKKTESAQLITRVDIASLIRPLCSDIDSRTHTDDSDILCFCLHHLFLNVDILTHVFTEQISSTDETCSAPLRDLMEQQAAWTRLQKIKHILERIEPLCQLLNDAARVMLSSLDKQATLPSPTDPTVAEDPSTASSIQPLSEQFQDALAPVLGTWSQCLCQQYTFHHSFAHLLSAIPTLARMDSAFSILLKNAGSLFSDTLPAFSTTRQDARATFFLDMMQKVDQILLQIDVIMVPLHTLIKQYALGTEMN